MNLEAAKLKYLELGEDIRKMYPQKRFPDKNSYANLMHTYSKLGMFLSEELGSLWDGATEATPEKENKKMAVTLDHKSKSWVEYGSICQNLMCLYDGHGPCKNIGNCKAFVVPPTTTEQDNVAEKRCSCVGEDEACSYCQVKEPI